LLIGERVGGHEEDDGVVGVMPDEKAVRWERKQSRAR
jgi:hypothetical protein